MTEREFVIDMRLLIDDVKEKVNNGQCVILKGEGVSMSPFITDADILTLKNFKHNKVKIGDIYLYQRNDGSYAIHRIYAHKKDWVYMLGDAQLLIEKVPKHRLIAVVATIKKPKKIIDCTNPFIRLRCIARMKMRIAKVKIRAIFHFFRNKTVNLLSRIKRMIKKER